MEVKAIHKFAMISDKKARPVMRAISGKPVAEALAVLANSPHRAAAMIAKVLKAAAANAENNDAVECDPEEMYISRATVDGGPSLGRWKFGARGRMMPRLKRMSHITIGLSERADSFNDDNDKDES